MIEPGHRKIKYTSSKEVLEKSKKIKGYISEKQARKAFLEFLCSNLWITTNLLFNIELFQIQVMMLKMMFNRSRVLLVLPRGFSKSWTTALFASLYALLNPGVRIGIVSATFRSSREIIKQIEKFAKEKGADLFKECVDSKQIKHATDYWSIQVGTSEIVALPLGERIRGFRFNLVIADELLLIPNDIIKSVVLPFLSTNTDPVRKQRIKEEEDKLIKAGLKDEEDRTIFENGKFIGLSSASFKFEDFYKTFENYEKKILHKDKLEESDKALTYGLMQFSWEAAPEGLYRDGFIEDARSQMSDIHFKREMCSIFVDSSGGFFNLEKMMTYSSKFGEAPYIEIVGDPKAEYILGIDPSFSDADDSDYFAMAVLKVDKTTNKTHLVHAYEVAGGKQINHIQYLAYVLQNFNIVYLIIDNAGWEFIDSCNNSQVFKEARLNIDKFEHDYENENKDEGLKITKQNYNKELGKIVHVQYFSAAWIDLSNTYLQTSLNFGRIWFCGAPDEGERGRLVSQAKNLPMEKLEFGDMDEFDKGFESEAKIVEFIDHVPFIVGRIREECSLIEVKISPTGTASYDLPRNLKLSKGKNRPRRDGYTALLLANYAARCYFDLMNPNICKNNYKPFIPQVIR